MRHAWSGRKHLIETRQALRVLTVLFVLVSARQSNVVAQTLDLSDAIDPPALEQPTAASRLMQQLESEAKELSGAEKSAAAIEQSILRASINCRQVAADLLAAGERAGKDGSQAILIGTRLAQHRTQIDDVLKRILNATHDASTELPDQQSAILSSLKSFNETVAARSRDGRSFDDENLDDVLHAIFAELANAIGDIEAAPIVSHWIPAGKVHLHAGAATSPNPIPIAEPKMSLDDLAARLIISPIPNQSHTQLADVIDFLKRGEQFPELRPRIERYRIMVAQLLGCADAVADAKWLNDQARQQYADRFAGAVSQFKEPATREAGERQIERLSNSRVVIERISALHDERFEIAPIAGAFLATELLIDDESRAEDGRRRLALLGQILERMIEYRRLQQMNFKRDLRLIERDLHKAYRAAEEALLKQVAALASKSTSLADPSFSTLVMDHKQLLADLQRLRKVPTWTQAIATIDPPSSEPFEKQARKMCKWLLDPNRRPDAIAAMDQFERQLELFRELPLELRLRATDPALIELSGGLNEKLLGQITEQRRKWAQAWADGDAAGEAANRMLMLYRLMQTMSDAAVVAQERDDAGVLNRWAAWELDPAAIVRPMTDVQNRVKLAIASAVEGDDAGAAQQLERIDRDAPLAKLAGRLSSLIGEDLSLLPDGARGVMGQLVNPPPAPGNSWMVQRRRELADVCRYATEYEFALATDRNDRARALNEYITALADRLLLELGEQRNKLPAVGGFDGSDPNPKMD